MASSFNGLHHLGVGLAKPLHVIRHADYRLGSPVDSLGDFQGAFADIRSAPGRVLGTTGNLFYPRICLGSGGGDVFEHGVHGFLGLHGGVYRFVHPAVNFLKIPAALLKMVA